MRVFEDRRDAGRRLAAVLGDDPALRGSDRVVVLAVPVAPQRAAADRVVVLVEPPEFFAVGRVYREFGQLDDASSLEILRELARG